MGIYEMVERKCLKWCCHLQCGLACQTLHQSHVSPVQIVCSYLLHHHITHFLQYHAVVLDINIIGQVLTRELIEAVFFWYVQCKWSTVTYSRV